MHAVAALRAQTAGPPHSARRGARCGPATRDLFSFRESRGLCHHPAERPVRGLSRMGGRCSAAPGILPYAACGRPLPTPPPRHPAGRRGWGRSARVRPRPLATGILPSARSTAEASGHPALRPRPTPRPDPRYPTPAAATARRRFAGVATPWTMAAQAPATRALIAVPGPRLASSLLQ